MAEVVVHRPKNLPEYLKLVETLQRYARHPLWFRGAGKATYRLLPSLYRHPSRTSSVDLQNLENQLLIRFRQRSLPYHSRDLSDDWEALFFMQHYGVPTRLLDWTENPLTGLHFALMSAHSTNKPYQTASYSNSAAVWILNPVKWNKAALTRLSYTGEPLSTGDEPLKGYSPRATPAETPTLPVAMYGTHNSARIVAQQGVFTIFGTNRAPMEDLAQTGAFPSGALFRVIVPPGRIQRVIYT